MDLLFQSERIDFVKVDEALIEDYLVLVNDPQVRRQIGSPPRTYTREDEKTWVNDKLNSRAPVYSMLERATGRFIGNIELMDLHDRRAMLGVAVTPAQQEKGFGREGIARLLSHAFEALGLQSLWLEVLSTNPRAMHVYSRLGFCAFDARRRTDSDGNATDGVFMELSRTRWERPALRRIELEGLPRRSHVEYFTSLPNPYVGVTANVDVSALRDFCRRRSASFYLAFMHVAARAADGVPELRQRLRDGGIVEHARCGTSHVELLEDGVYTYCTLWHDDDWDSYLPYAEAARRRCRERVSLEEDADVDALYFISTLPWLHYTAIWQPTGVQESNPRITWGRFEEDARGRWMMPLTLLAHHALVDGLQIARFFQNVEAELQRLPKGD